MTSSCSFRITRTAEDLAQTINALSQRLVRLEQRQQAIELKLTQTAKDPSLEELQMLDGVDQLLKECNELLETSSSFEQNEELSIQSPEEENEVEQDVFAA